MHLTLAPCNATEAPVGCWPVPRTPASLTIFFAFGLVVLRLGFDAGSVSFLYTRHYDTALPIINQPPTAVDAGTRLLAQYLQDTCYPFWALGGVRSFVVWDTECILEPKTLS